jgi:hypothetical protein
MPSDSRLFLPPQQIAQTETSPTVGNDRYLKLNRRRITHALKQVKKKTKPAARMLNRSRLRFLLIDVGEVGLDKIAPLDATREWQLGRALQERVDLFGAGSALLDAPHDKRLSSAAVARGEDAGDAGRVRDWVAARLDVAPPIHFDTERLNNRLLRSHETERKEAEIAITTQYALSVKQN